MGLSFITIIAMFPTFFKYKQNPFMSFYHYFSNIIKLDFGGYKLNFYDRFAKPIFPDLFHFYSKSISYLIFSIIIGIALGILFSIVILLLKKKWRKPILWLNYFLISFPDFLLILILQALVIWIYQKTGTSIGNVYSRVDDEAILLPMITLSLFPFIYTLRNSLNTFEGIFTKDFILFAYAKGLSKREIIFSHMLKNALPIILASLPSILQVSIANLFIVELVYGIPGIMKLLYNNQTMEVIFPSLLFIWLTYFVVDVGIRFGKKQLQEGMAK